MTNIVKRGMWLFAFVLCVSVFCAATVRAQSTAAFVGTVTDASGGAIPDAKVIVRNLGTGAERTVQTGASGDYALTQLAGGSYSLSVERSGFKTFTVPSIILAAGDRARVDAKLEVGAVTETVEVKADVAPLLQTDSATVGGLVTSEAVENLPINGRNSIRLIQLSPGVNDNQSGNTGGVDDRRQSSTVVANAQGGFENNFILDGMDNNERTIATIVVKPSIDAIQEIKVDTNLYSADVGRVGGAVVSMVTKSGTNQIHGTAYEFVRNDMFDARNFFNNQAKPEYRQNQFGGSVGGPIRKDKTFFFADYEALRIIQGITQTNFTPTPCELGRAACPDGKIQLGDFSDLIPAGTNCSVSPVAGCIFDPISHAAYPGNIVGNGGVGRPIPRDSANYAALFPNPTSCPLGPGKPCTYLSNFNRIQYAHTADARIDHRFSDKDTVFGRYSINNTDTVSPNGFPNVTVAGLNVAAGGIGFGAGLTGPLGVPGTNYGRQQNVNIGWVHIFRPNLLTDFHVSISRFVSASDTFNAGQNVNAAFGGPGNMNVPGVDGADGLANVLFGTDAGVRGNGNLYSSLGDAYAAPTHNYDTDYNYAANVTWNHGAHNIKFGANLMRRDWSVLQLLFKGGFAFSGTTTAANGIGGNDFASLLTGYAFTVNRNMALIAPQDSSWEIGEYLQDNWRATRWLTLNLGIRYDIFTPTKEKHNALSNFDPTDPSQLAGGKVIVAGQNGVSDTVNIDTEYDQFQPRLGFAATLGNGFVLRGGFGMSYSVSNVFSPAALKNPPFAASVSLTGPTAFDFGAGTLPFPSIDPATQCLAGPPRCVVPSPPGTPAGTVPATLAVSNAESTDFHNQKLYMYNVTLEKAFGANVISAAWVGVPGRHLFRTIPNINIPLPPNGPGGCGLIKTPLPASSNLCRPYAAQLPIPTSIQLAVADGSSSYNGLTVVFQRRYQAGLTVQGNYTYAQAFADTGSFGGACTACGIVPTNPRYDWGYSLYDVRHRVAISANYELPFGKSLHSAFGKLAGGWAVNGIYTFSTGLPFVVTESTGQMGFAGVTDRPNALPRTPFTQSLNEWFNTENFALQPFGTAGNEGNNQFFGPSQKRLDFSLFKDFPIRESLKLQFRTEVFNITNTPSFGFPNSGIGAGWCPASGVSGGASCVPGHPTNYLNGSGFGKITSTSASYSPRDIQFALKLVF